MQTEIYRPRALATEFAQHNARNERQSVAASTPFLTSHRGSGVAADGVRGPRYRGPAVVSHPRSTAKAASLAIAERWLLLGTVRDSTIETRDRNPRNGPQRGNPISRKRP